MCETHVSRLRPVEVTPIRYEERDLFLLRDPNGLAPEPLLLSPASAHLLRFFDGQHTVGDMQVELTRASGQIVPREQLGRFVEKLDEALFLDSPRFARYQKAYAEEYAALPHRPARFAGEAYAQDPDALRRELDSLYTAPGGPGAPEPAGAWPRAIAAPHIDIGRGAGVYAHAYRALWGAAPERIVVLGVCHAPARNPFIVTVKDYATPLGVAPTDRDLIRALMGKLDWNPLDEQELHRAEHSIEFQVLLLQHALARGGAQAAEVPIVPILCGLSWSDFYETHEGTIGTDRRTGDFLTALREVLAEADGAADAGADGAANAVPEEEAGGPRAGSPATVVVAGIDLAHVGIRFGAREGLDPQKRARLEARDLATLSLVAGGDRDGFVRETLAERDERHLCGFGALYSLLTVVPDARGRVVAYDQAVDPDEGSVVTFGAMWFTEPRS